MVISSELCNTRESKRCRQRGRRTTHFPWSNRTNHHDQITILGRERDILESKWRILKQQNSATMTICLNHYLPRCWEPLHLNRSSSIGFIECSSIIINGIRSMIFIGHEEFLFQKSKARLPASHIQTDSLRYDLMPPSIVLSWCKRWKSYVNKYDEDTRWERKQ